MPSVEVASLMTYEPLVCVDPCYAESDDCPGLAGWIALSASVKNSAYRSGVQAALIRRSWIASLFLWDRNQGKDCRARSQGDGDSPSGTGALEAVFNATQN